MADQLAIGSKQRKRRRFCVCFFALHAAFSPLATLLYTPHPPPCPCTWSGLEHYNNNDPANDYGWNRGWHLHKFPSKPLPCIAWNHLIMNCKQSVTRNDLFLRRLNSWMPFTSILASIQSNLMLATEKRAKHHGQEQWMEEGRIDPSIHSTIYPSRSIDRSRSNIVVPPTSLDCWMEES